MAEEKISAREVVGWLRQQSARYNSVADNLERNIGVWPACTYVFPAPEDPAAYLDAESHKPMRAEVLALRYQVPEAVVEAALESCPTIKKNSRGWWSLVRPVIGLDGKAS